MENATKWIKLFFVSFSTIVIGFLGGWDTALKVLFAMTAIDILTGLLSGVYHKNINSGKAYQGAIKKLGIYLLVGLSCLLDDYLGIEVARSAVIGYFIATEGISILENWGKMGLPLPKILKAILIQIREQSEGIENETDTNY
ncbi:MAG: phage holin family protein [Clostridiaceae bacterium]|nr:phage holin family protein [Clostridiaceae bacterium]